MSGVDDAIDFLRFVLSSICNEEEEIEIDVARDDRGVIVTVQVSGADMGKLIGKKGQNITAIRTLIHVMGSREGEKISLKVLEK